MSKPIDRWFFLAAGAPLLAGCSPGTCGAMGGPPTQGLERWDGGIADGGSLSDAGYLDFATCQALCARVVPNATSCHVEDAGLVLCSQICIGGRAPPGLVSLSGVDGTTGSWLARMAELEAAAVHAFMHLALELDAHGLPRFADAALRAAEHEVQHARRITGLALRSGHCPRPLAMEPSEVRSLEALAIDNAGEGCGRELFGAVVNAHQARTARDPDVAATMGAIAGEEAQHAALSFELAAALMPRLTVPQRRRAREAQAQVLERLGADEVHPAARAALGLPDGAQAAATARALLESRRV